jgi:N6-adenosine-specific RNA methylase IME4
MSMDDLAQLPVRDVATEDSVLVCWITWPMLQECLGVIGKWGFEYKTCAFCWMKGHARQIEMFHDDITPHMTLGYWTRSNSEVALLATRGKPKRLDAGIRQGIIEPRREHSRKPDCVHERIERLVSGPYLELFARQQRPGWTVWGNETDKFGSVVDYDPAKDMEGSTNECYRAIRERVAAGGPGFDPDREPPEYVK